jgi:hypothetical protein
MTIEAISENGSDELYTEYPNHLPSVARTRPAFPER